MVRLKAAMSDNLLAEWKVVERVVMMVVMMVALLENK